MFCNTGKIYTSFTRKERKIEWLKIALYSHLNKFLKLMLHIGVTHSMLACPQESSTSFLNY